MKKDELTPELRSFITYLATNSRNFRQYRVLFLVSNPEVLEVILALNGGEKFALAIDPKEFKWDLDCCRQLMHNKLVNYREKADIERAVTLCAPASCAGVVYTTCEFMRNNVQEEVMKSKIQKVVIERQVKWAAFEKLGSEALYQM